MRIWGCERPASLQPDFNSDNFSAPDRRYFNDRGTQRPGYVGYLGTPGGTFRRYDTSDKSDKPF
jgi:hypothetical protein